MRTKTCLTLEDVAIIVDAARRKAVEIVKPATIAVVDDAGLLLYLERPDHQPGNSVDMAVGKARTAAFRERPSATLQERVKEKPGFLTYPGAVAVAGGIPLFHKGQIVGGIGVSGIGDDDEAAAIAGAEAMASL